MIHIKGNDFRLENFIGMQQGQVKGQIKVAGTETANDCKCDKCLTTFENEGMGAVASLGFKERQQPQIPLFLTTNNMEILKKMEPSKTGLRG